MFYLQVPLSHLPDDHDKRMSVLNDIKEGHSIPEWCISQQDRDDAIIKEIKVEDY